MTHTNHIACIKIDDIVGILYDWWIFSTCKSILCVPATLSIMLPYLFINMFHCKLKDGISIGLAVSVYSFHHTEVSTKGGG